MSSEQQASEQQELQGPTGSSGAVLGSLFALPEEWVLQAVAASLRPTIAADQQQQQQQQQQDDAAPLTSSLQRLRASSRLLNEEQQQGEGAGSTCLACGIGLGTPGFSGTTEQRAHFKTDWHRYNVKRRLAKQPPVTEEQFETMLEGGGSEVSSISGSSSSEDEDNEGGQHRRGMAAALPPRAVFLSQSGQPFCVWKCLLERDHIKGGHAEALTPFQQLTELQRLRSHPGLFVVLLLRGGHFAAAVFRSRQAAPASQQQRGAKQQQVQWAGVGAAGAGQEPSKAAVPLMPPGAAPADVFEVVAHKTFHRYVVRAKAGGKQSAKDASGKYARSAGAALRRYNEAALDRDIAELLASWRAHLDAASLIFVQAPASNSASIFASGSDASFPNATLAAVAATSLVTRGVSLGAAGAAAAQALIHPSDPRVRRIPFVTQRPTFAEARRVVGLLLAVFEPTAAALAAQQAVDEASQAVADQKARARALRKQQKQQQQQAVGSAGPSGPGQASAAGTDDEHDGGKQDDGVGGTQQLQETLLHAAARQGDASAVLELLEQGADPCARDSRGRTAYAVAADKAARDTFRRYMAEAPEQWDWTAAGVPSALTEELLAAQAAKKAEKRARQKVKEKERKLAQTEEAKQAAAQAAKAALGEEIVRAAAEAAALAAKLEGGKGKQQVGGRGAGGKQAASSAHSEAPLTLEQIAQRRDMMAAAAEARMKALQQAVQQQRLHG